MALHFINATLKQDKTLVLAQDTQVNSGENLATGLKITIPMQFDGYNFNLEFLLPNQKKYVTGFLPTVVEEDQNLTLYYTPDRSLFSVRGRVYVQVCGRKTEDTDTVEVFKSVMSADASFFVNPSIFDANEPFISKDTLTEICETLNKAQELLDKIQEDLNNGEFNAQGGTTPDITMVATTLPSGSNATVTKSGTTQNPTFTLGIPKGEKGDKGDNGQDGANGQDGQKGDKGTTFVPSVDSNGNLSWSNSDGLTNPTTVNIKGPRGATGSAGKSVINITPTVDLEYSDNDLSGLIDSLIDVYTDLTTIALGSIAIVPFYHADTFSMRVLGGDVRSFSSTEGKFTLLVRWFIN